MNKKIPAQLTTVMILLVLSITACQGVQTAPPPPSANTSAPVIPQTGNNTPAAQNPVQIPATQSPTAIQHQTTPGVLPDKHLDRANDQDSSTTAPKKIAPGGDQFILDQFERPFNANTMNTYYPYLDIQEFQVSQDATWTYVPITLKGLDANKVLSGQYAVELDTNRDGRGDWLIIATKPISTNWTTNGVQIFQDANHDVGGKTPVRPDSPPGGDGYEKLVFDQGQGTDPDAAWVSLSSTNPNVVQIAFKTSFFNSKAFLVNAWAGSKLDPAMFDPNDHLTSVQAGSPLFDLSTYPIKQLAELDNTCRLAIGFTPTGKEPGLCTVQMKLQADQPVPEGPSQSKPKQPGTTTTTGAGITHQGP